jgi:predicted PurR-regulated permease PerM
MRDFLKQYIFTRTFGERLFSLMSIIIIFIVMKDFAIFFLATFLCAYLFHEATEWSQKHIHWLAKKGPKQFSPLLLGIAEKHVLLTALYLFFAFVCIFAIRDIGPALTRDMIDLLQWLSQRISVNLGIAEIQYTLSKWQNLSSQINHLLNIISPQTDTSAILDELLRISGLLMQILFAYILSYIWLLEYEKVEKYFWKIKKGPFSFFYRDIKIILEKIQKSFWVVFQAQSKIAIINTLLTVLGMVVIGLFYQKLSPDGDYIYPYLLALWCITFIASFIPILWIFIGGLPIVFAGVVEYPGWSIVVTVITMIIVIHAFEWYFLSPRLVGKWAKLPIPVVFLILVMAEHFIGVIGVFIGVPLYLLVLELFASIGHAIEKIQKPV